MSGGVEVTGMVLLAVPYAEYDRRVVLLTRERGRITAFARGARRMGSPLMAAASPFCFGTFTVYEGRSAYTLVGAQISEYFEELRNDYLGACYGTYFMELAEYYARENLDGTDMLNLLFAALRSLTRGTIPRRLTRYVFEIRLMVINGEYPQDIALEPSLSGTARYTLSHIFQTPLNRLFFFSVSASCF